MGVGRDGINDGDFRGEEVERAMEEENGVAVGVEDGGADWSMGVEELALEGALPGALLFLEEEAECVAGGVEDAIAVSLLEAHQQVEHLELSHHHQRRLREQLRSWMVRPQHLL